MKNTFRLMAAGLLVWGAGSFTITPAGAKTVPRGPEAADDILKASCDRLSKAHHMRFFAQTSVERVNPGGQRNAFAQRVDLLMRRPDRLCARVRGELDNVDLWYDGRALTKLTYGGGKYSVLPVSGSVEQVLDLLAEKFGSHFPLADFLVDDVYANFTKNNTSSEYVGVDTSGGFPAHHLKFTQAAIDWEIWIHRGRAGLPCKLHIVYKSQPGSPSYTAVISGWDLDNHEGRYRFEPKIPADAQQVEFQLK
jgi:hypothetical protein